MLPQRSSEKPFAGVRVLDLGQVYQGPYATFLMAQAGADVVKLEPPGGESIRRREAGGGPASFPVALLASGKRAITLDLKRAEGRDLLGQLAGQADVLLENFAPGVMERLGLGWDRLRTLNPRLIYASGTAFGITGPDYDRPGMDITVQAATGVMSITGERDAGPLKAGPALCDILGGAHLFGAVAAALFAREHTGSGQIVEVSMQEATYPTLISKLAVLHATGENPPRLGNRHGLVAPYNVYATRDGHVALICLTDEHWRALADAMGQPRLGTAARFATHADRIEHVDELEEIVASWARTLDRDIVLEVAREHRVPCAPVRDLAELNRDPHLHERGFLQDLDHPQLGAVTLPSSPLRFGAANPPPLVPSARLGAHNREVYSEWLDLSDAEIRALKQRGVI